MRIPERLLSAELKLHCQQIQADSESIKTDSKQCDLLDRFCAAQLRFRTHFVIRFFALCEALAESDRDTSDNAEIVRGASFLLSRCLYQAAGSVTADSAACTEFSLESDF